MSEMLSQEEFDRWNDTASDTPEAEVLAGHDQAQRNALTAAQSQLRAITDLTETMCHELWCHDLKHPDKESACDCIRGKILKLATPGAESGIGLAALKILLADTELLLTLERQDTDYLTKQLATVTQEKDVAIRSRSMHEQRRGDILSLIHRDGGQHIAANGWEPSQAEAERIVTELRTRLEAAESQRDALYGKPEAVHLGARSAIEALRQVDGIRHELDGLTEVVQKVVDDYRDRGSVSAPLLDALCAAIDAARETTK